jgi:integrase
MSIYRRGKVWWIRFQHDGREIRRSAHTTVKRTAEEFEKELREELGRQRRGGEPARTFDDMMLRFTSEHLPDLAPSSQERYIISAQHMVPHFSGLYLHQVTLTKLDQFISYRRREGASASTVRRDLACLSSAYRSAIGWGWADANPVKMMDKRRVKVGDPRTRYLTREEFDRLIEAASPYLRPAIAFAVHTGLRREEQLSLTWDQVHYGRREVFVPVTKTGTPRTVPLTDGAIAALRSIARHISAPWVFCTGEGERYRRLTRGLAGAARRAGIEDLRWHDLRRTCGSWLLQSGVDIFRVSRWLGHKTVAVTERSYAFLNIADLHDAAQMSAHGHLHSKAAESTDA